MEVVELDVHRGFTPALLGRVVTRTIDIQPAITTWPPTRRIEQVSYGGIRVGVCRSWLPDPRLADLNNARIPEAALLHMAAGLTGDRAHIAALTVSTRPSHRDDDADLNGAVTIVQVNTTWCTSSGTVVLHSLARWRGDRVHLTVPVSTQRIVDTAPCPVSCDRVTEPQRTDDAHSPISPPGDGRRATLFTFGRRPDCCMTPSASQQPAQMAPGDQPGARRR